RQLLLQLRRHLLRAGLAHELAQALLEAVALAAVAARIQVRLRLGPLRLVEDAIEERLHGLFALVTGIVEVRHVPPAAAFSARLPFRIRRPRCRRDMTVPIGMSRICAASW